ncbi:MAG: carbamoyltransferase [Acidobacteriota bacterium]
MAAKDVYVLGLSCFYHDSAACILKNGEVLAAASEERFTRKKHDAAFPEKALQYCLKHAGISASELTAVGFYDKPFLKFERIIQTYLQEFPRGFKSYLRAVPVWLNQKLWMRREIEKRIKDYGGEILFVEHHLSHAASAFMVSPFQDAAILTIDGVGEWATSSMGVGRGSSIELTHEIRFPHSLGLLYSAFTYYLGFKVNSAEYKVMGLAPYGEPKYVDTILKELVEVRDDGSFRLNLDYFCYMYDLKMTNSRMEKLFGHPVREGEGKLDQFHKDLAASIQKVTELIVLNMTRELHRISGMKYLCMAGGVALNCVANGKVLRQGLFEDLFVQPAAGDAGGALGVASYLHHAYLGNERWYKFKSPFLGPEYTEEEIQQTMDAFGARSRRVSDAELLKETARIIADKNVVGWFQGRMEYGPRSLGSRSILGDARFAEMRDTVNLKIKFRESFRPFAPTVLAEKVSEWFDLDRESPYMLLVADVLPDKRTIPAVTHVDHSARIQTIARDDNPRFYDLVREYEKITGCPVIINTSFNVRGEPIVMSPKDAYLCFMRTHMDYLVMGNFILDKREQAALREDVDWRKEFVLD